MLILEYYTEQVEIVRYVYVCVFISNHDNKRQYVCFPCFFFLLCILVCYEVPESVKAKKQNKQTKNYVSKLLYAFVLMCSFDSPKVGLSRFFSYWLTKFDKIDDR